MWSQNFNWIPSNVCCFVLLANWEVISFYVFDGTRWLRWAIFRPVGLQSGVSHEYSWIFFSYSSDQGGWQIPAAVIGMCWIFLIGRSGVWMLQHPFSCGLFRMDGSLISLFVDLWHRPRSVFHAGVCCQRRKHPAVARASYICIWWWAVSAAKWTLGLHYCGTREAQLLQSSII